MKRSLSRGEKGLWAVCALLVLGLVGMAILKSQVDAEPDWGIPEPKPTPNPNGIDLYVAASNAMIRANPAVDAVNDSPRLTDTKQMAERYSLLRRTAWIAQNAGAWALFEKAKAAESLQPANRSIRPTGFRSNGALRQLARAKVVLVNTDKMRGDWNGAARNGLDIFEMSGDAERGGPYLTYLVVVAIDAMGQAAFADIPSHLSGKEAKSAAQRLEKLLASRPTLVDSLTEEKWTGLSQMREMMTTEPWRKPSTWGRNSSLFQSLNMQFLSKRQVVETYKNEADWSIANAQQPYPVKAPKPPFANNLVNRTFEPLFGRVKFIAVKSNTDFSQLLLRLALRAYRMDKGSYPATLNELTPTYLAKIPLDPFGGATPLLYQKTGDSYLIWSIGPDGKEDGGKVDASLYNGRKVLLTADNQGDIIARPEMDVR